MDFTDLDKKIINVALFNGSSPIAPFNIKESLNFIEKHPFFNLLLNKSDIYHIDNITKYLSRPPEINAKKFTELLYDDEIDIIWCARGGYGILKWLQHIDWERIKELQSIPLVIGFSDVTFLHSCLSNSKKISLHAPLFTTLPKSSENTLNNFLITLSECPQTLKGNIFKEGEATGKLIGGNLTCLIHTIGTPFEPNWDNSILFLEDHNEAPYRIDRMLTHLFLSGRLEKIKGICFGEFFHNNEKIDLKKIIKITINELNIPVLLDLPIGHGQDNLALLIGSHYKIDGFKGILEPIY